MPGTVADAPVCIREWRTGMVRAHRGKRYLCCHTHLDTSISLSVSDIQSLLGTHFTCFTGTKVQLLTQKALYRKERLMYPSVLTSHIRHIRI